MAKITTDILNKIVFNNGFVKSIYTEPYIIYTQHKFFRDYALGNNKPNAFFKDVKCYLLSTDNWYWNDNKYRKDQYQLILDGYNKFIHDYPNVKVIFMHPDANNLKGYPNIPYILFNRNALIDVNSYNINENNKKIYDSIYNANLYKYKRHYLIENLPNIGLIYYLRTEKNKIKYINDDEMQYGIDLETNYSNKSNITLINKLSGNYKFLNKKELSYYYGQTYSGLILSDIEGICLASVEYLLCGIPVISTKNFGGRDFFLSGEEYAITNVDDNSKDIFECIQYYKHLNLNRYYVRSRIIYKINEHWKTLLPQLNKYIKEDIDFNTIKNNFITAQNYYKV